MLESRHPFESFYAPSVLAAFRSAISLINMASYAVREMFQGVLRNHDLLFYVLSCGVSKFLAPCLFSGSICFSFHPPMKVIFGSVACKDSPAAFAEAARRALDKTVATLEVAKEHPTVRKCLVSGSDIFCFLDTVHDPSL